MALEKRLIADKKRFDIMNKNLLEEMKNFKAEINQDINNLLKIYKEMQMKTANEVVLKFF